MSKSQLQSHLTGSYTQHQHHLEANILSYRNQTLKKASAVVIIKKGQGSLKDTLVKEYKWVITNL